jgi:hypothetical protein
MGMESKFKFVILVSVMCVGVQLPSLATAQPVQTSEPRQTPAPWRPSFGSINQNAIAAPSVATPIRSGASTSGAANRSTGQPAANSQSPRSTANPNPGVNSIPGSSDSRTIQPGVTRVTKTMDKLPNSAGQIWREYDISPYTSRVTNSEDPQKAITEWILRETGTEMWFHQPLGILSADKNKIYVYHTPEIHNIVKSIVDRFVRTRGQVQNIDVNLVTVGKPNWRSQSYTMLQPIEVKSAGVEAWMISKENAAILMGQLSRRADFKQHSGGRLSNHDGQSFTLEKTQPVQFVRNLKWVPNQVPNYQPLMTSLDEGYRLNLSCLSAMDNATIEAVIKCDVDQVEKLTSVKVNLPGSNGAGQQMTLQIPQVVSWRLHERFRWPNDQVLLLSCGVVATPEPDSGGIGLRIPGFSAKAKRADALLFIEYRGPAQDATIPRTAGNHFAPIPPRQ